MSRKFYKTVIPFEVLSEEPIPDPMDLGEVLYETLHGGYSMRVLDRTETELTGPQAAEALKRQGSDPEFFGLDDDGADLSEDL